MDDAIAPILLSTISGLTMILVFCGLIWAARQDGQMQRHHDRRRPRQDSNLQPSA